MLQIIFSTGVGDVLRVFYGCYTGVHTSLLAAGFHLGWFDNRTGFRDCRKRMDKYGSLTYKQIGKPLFWGCDENGHEVYTIGLTTERKVFNQAVNALFGLYNYSFRDYHLVDTSDCAGKLAAVGNGISGFPFLRPWGEALIEKSLARNLESVAKLVQDTKAYLNSL